MNDLVKKLLKELNIEATSEQRAEFEEDLRSRFENITLEVLLDSLFEEQRQELMEAMDSEEGLQQKIQDLAAEVPGLQQKIDAALNHEINLIRLTFGGK